MITFDIIKNDPEIRTYLQKGNDYLGEMGYTEHSLSHATIVSNTAARILEELNYGESDIELARIAGYMHDIGNAVNRVSHAQSGALLANYILNRLNMPYEDVAEIVCAIGNHDESEGFAASAITAALILADKSDVRRTRVREQVLEKFDIHDRVNYSVEKSHIEIESSIILNLTIDTEICSLSEYFEIFLGRMLMCKRAANFLDLGFSLQINNIKLM